MLAENMETVTAFLLVQTQWRWSQGVCMGLDYASCKVALDANGVDIRRVMRGLQVMEAAVMEAD